MCHQEVHSNVFTVHLFIHKTVNVFRQPTTVEIEVILRGEGRGGEGEGRGEGGEGRGRGGEGRGREGRGGEGSE